MAMTAYKIREKSRIIQDKKEACVTFNRDMSCKKGTMSNAWHARAMDYTQRMNFLCQKIQRTADAFLGKEHLFPVSKIWTCKNYYYNLETLNRLLDFESV
jgi:hypothetical protein